MKKLKNKIFVVLLGILTTFLLSILFIFNFQDYKQEENSIMDNLTRMSLNHDRIDEKKIDNSFEDKETLIEDGNPKIFMDNIVYVVDLNDENEIVQVTNHSQNNNITNEEIIAIAQNIIYNSKDKKTHIGSLYFEQYAYSFKPDKSLVIIDNTQAKDRLVIALKNSLLIFLILEIVIVYVTKKLTQWIIKPVEESFERQKQFIADASHEFKTPLAVIIASSEALENEPNEKKWLDNIKEEAERMNNLITDLLDMARSENVSKKQFEKTNMSKIVERSVLTFESLIYEKNIKLDYKIEENINFQCNANQIKQLIGILIDNAIKYSSKDGEIDVTLKEDKNTIVLNVKNKGKEISKEQQKKIFERFYRADESRNRSENRYGLGLAIAKNIVESHNGKISVQSSDGYNSFIIIFKQV